MAKEHEIVPIPVASLELDPANPRLPEGMDGSASEEVIRYYWDNYVLDELIESFRANGYFAHEPLIVMKRGSKFTVLEGNRRLAALIQLLGLPGNVEKLTDPAPAKLAKELEEIPCLVVKDRQEVASYLGFRHIGGIKPWPPESKARFVADQLRLAAKGKSNPFAAVARMVGTNAQGVRLSYFALELLKYARSEYGIDTSHVARLRFGVWLRCMSSQGVLTKLAVSVPQEFKEFPHQIQLASKAWLTRIVSDLSPSEKGEPVLSDSRDVTVYGHVLASERAYKALQQTRDLRIAEQMVGSGLISAKIAKVADRVKALVDEAEDIKDPEKEAIEAAELLMKRAKTLLNTLTP